MAAISDCMSAHMSDRQKVIWKVDIEDFKTHSKSKVFSKRAQLRRHSEVGRESGE